MPAKNAKLVFQNLVSEFIASLDGSAAMTSTYANALKQLGRYLKNCPQPAFTRENVIAFREHLKAEGRKAATIQLYLVAARRFFRWLHLNGSITSDIAAGIKGVKTGNDFVKSHLSAESAAILLQGIDRATIAGKRDYALIALLLTTGLRTIEASRANKSDVKRMGDEQVLFIQGKGHEAKDAYVKLSQDVQNALESCFEARKDKNPTQPLFASLSRRNEGLRLTTRSIRRIIKNRLKVVGMDDDLLSAHSLRHTAATLNLEAGGTLEETQQLLRHRNINTTMRYAHALKRERNQSEHRIASAIFGATEKPNVR